MMLRFFLSVFFLSIFTPGILAQERPNLIFILTDDQRWDALGYQGNPIIQTPQMDKLAEEGIYFENAFVTTPICAASRASIMTSQYERTHGYTFQQPPVSKELIETSYLSKLKEAGYYNGFLGKLGVPFEDRWDTTLFDAYFPEGARYWRKKENGDSIHLTDLTGERAVNFIKQVPDDQPFHLSISFNAPHADDGAAEQYFWPHTEEDLYKDVTIPVPIMSTEEDFMAQPEYVRSGFNRVRWYWRYDTPEKYQEMVKGYYRMISGVDRILGDIRAALREKGVEDNTVIILMGDNGYFLGERQLAGKWLMYEQSLRVPLIIYDPRHEKHWDVDELVTNLDIAPTLLDYASIDIPDSYQGYSLAGYTQKGGKIPRRKSFLVEHLWDFDNIPASEGIRTRKYKYFRYLDDPDHEEFYLLKRDPFEKTNLVNVQRYSRKLDKLREQTNLLIEGFN